MRSTIALLFGTVVLAACGSSHLRSDLVDPRAVHRMQSVLVMPLQNLSGTPNADYAVADEVAARLRFYPNLVVRELPWLQLQLRKQGIAMPESRDPNTITALARLVQVDAVLTGAIYEYGFFREQRSVSDHVVVGLRLDLYAPDDTRLLWSGSSGHSMGNELSSFRPVLSDVASNVIAALLEDMFERTEAYVLSEPPVSAATNAPSESAPPPQPQVTPEVVPQVAPPAAPMAPAAASTPTAESLPALAVPPMLAPLESLVPPAANPAADEDTVAPVEPPDSASQQEGGTP